MVEGSTTGCCLFCALNVGGDDKENHEPTSVRYDHNFDSGMASMGRGLARQNAAEAESEEANPSCVGAEADYLRNGHGRDGAGRLCRASSMEGWSEDCCRTHEFKFFTRPFKDCWDSSALRLAVAWPPQ